MTFADIYLCIRKINVSKLNLKDRILQRSFTSVETSVYPPNEKTKVAMLVSKLILTNPLPHQTLLLLHFYLTNPGRNEEYNFLSLFQNSTVALNSIPFSRQFQVLILQNRTDNKIKFKIGRYVGTFRFNLLYFPSWIKIRGESKFL